MEQIKITLTGSLIGSSPKQKAVAKSLGLARIGDTTVQPDNEMTRGKINQISYLIKVEEMN